MKALVKMVSNGMNYFFIEDWDNNTTALFDWDLSESEVNALIQKFEENGCNLDEADSANGYLEWNPTEEEYEGLFGREILA